MWVMRMFWKTIKIILVLVCMISIFMFSNDPAYKSDKKSNFVIVSIAEFLAGHSLDKEAREEKIDEYVVLVRKSAHFIIYFLLGLFVISLIKEYKVIDIKYLIYAFIFCLLYACSDEVHQLFVVGRSGNIIDVIIDSIGSIFGILCYYGYYLIRRKYEQEKTIC